MLQCIERRETFLRVVGKHPENQICAQEDKAEDFCSTTTLPFRRPYAGAMGAEGFFPGRGVGNSGDISFHLLGTERTIFVC